MEAVAALLGEAWGVSATLSVGSAAGGVRGDIVSRPGAAAQSYEIRADGDGIVLTAQDEAGLFYAFTTLQQWLAQGPGDRRGFVIEDAPDFPVRGVMLDISRDKVPTMETLRALIDRLADWKINHLQLYTEHTFFYTRHPEGSVGASPITAEEARQLDAYGRERFMELVPNQNSFGHLHRWLKLPAYRHLAECEGEFLTPWGDRRVGPFSLNPLDPRSLDLLADWYDELLPCFSSRRVNVGCDETFDVGCGKSRGACEARGKGRVYLEFLKKVRGLVEARGHTMMFWADILLNHAELIPELEPGAVPLVWGYEADHPFEEQCAQVAGAGHRFYVCPGTSSWLSMAGRWENARNNLFCAAEAGLRHGAEGYLITDWGDQGHWQMLPVSYPGWLYGAALAWGAAANRDLPLAEALDRFVFRDKAGVAGHVLLGLANLYQEAPPLVANQSQLFRLLRRSDADLAASGVTAESLGRILRRAEGARERLASACLACPDAALILDEIATTAGWIAHACRRGVAVLEGGTCRGRPDLAEELRGLLGRHRVLWRSRNREGGLEHSLGPLESLLRQYGGEELLHE